jgi:hypothetical protein
MAQVSRWRRCTRRWARVLLSGATSSAAAERGWGEVGGKVADGDVHLVAHGAHHGDGGACDGPCHRLFVEAPEIFEGTAAASDDEHIHLGAAVGMA